MAVPKTVLVGSGVAATVVVAGFVAWFFLIGNPYDAPVREVSLKLDALAQVQQTPNATIGDLQNKVSLFDQELSSSATKLPAGKNEEIVRSYYGASLGYVKSLDRWLDAKAKHSATKEVIDNPSAFASRCADYSDPLTSGTCLLQAGSQLTKALDEYKATANIYISSIENRQKAMETVVDARDKANTVVSKSSIVTMSSFDQLLARSK